MTKYKSCFEDLPNELLTDIFKNLDARNLFRTFHNLNNRLNQLIQSFQYLQLIFHINQANLFKSNDEIFSYYVHTLIINPWINVNLIQFPNVHCLQLDNPLPEVLAQLKPEIMPYLEHLSIRYKFNMYEMDLLRDKIFSNRFLHLKSCELLEEKTLMTKPNCIQSPSIKILKTELIDFNIYQTILSACPNLYFLKFSIYPLNGMPTNIFCHENLKRMIIDYQESDWYYADDRILSGFLSCVSNLEIFEIHRNIDFENIEQRFGQYDWLASIIHIRLSRLRKFKYIVHLYKITETIDENILMQIQTNFNDVHKGQYKAQLEIRR
jgi:hypothetical protein